MTREDLEPDLQELGDTLRAWTTIDLACSREDEAVDAGARRPPRRGLLPRPRAVLGGTLGLAGVGTALVLMLSAGSATAPPAFAIVTHSDGSLNVNLDDPNNDITPLNNRLSDMGTDEHIEYTMARGPATAAGAVDCVPSPRGATVPGPTVTVTVGPGDSNTETIAGNTGAGVWHVASCQRLRGAQPEHLVSVGNGVQKLEPGDGNKH